MENSYLGAQVLLVVPICGVSGDPQVLWNLHSSHNLMVSLGEEMEHSIHLFWSAVVGLSGRALPHGGDQQHSPLPVIGKVNWFYSTVEC